ncbi:hypothetical protein [Cellulomonas gilvus]|uniref:Uncharacterized protein n=1 Tax=Cellulomonas gilvus (strain ATCC 13127 / NRRL B-14078) TaxID=593907 RepID=F8A2G4_CELGA|nr:hypothetical protein [Cellulomonas gilvus]AEI11821.1 hypothetical protein Celgi_1302 [Cellulomonas gilvus ATCC 13127]
MAQKKIRDDLEGVTFVHIDGLAVQLRAGDDVPKGAKVGEHLLASSSTKRTGPTPPPDPTSVVPLTPGNPAELGPAAEQGATAGADKQDDDQDPTEDDEPADPLTPPNGRSSRDAWALWAAAHGVEHAEDATKDEIRTAVAAAQQ